MSVVVLGSINLDLITRVAHRPQPGETILADAFQMSPGGKGANQALAARRMGATVHMIGAVGNDDFADSALRLLRADGVDLTYVQSLENVSTGLAFIHLDAAGENSITVVSGANAVGESVVLTSLEDVLTAQDILVLQLEMPISTVIAAIACAQRKGASVLIDPAPSPDTIPTALVAVDICMPNRGEAEQILGHRINDQEQARHAAAELRQRGAKIGIVKLGAQGVAWATEQGTFYEPASKVQAVDTTGAGDTFAGALAAFLANGYTFDEAVVLANRAAALATLHVGAQQAIPHKDAVLNRA